MKRRNEEEIEFDSICFHKDCIKEGEQLFNETNYSQLLAHSLHKEFYRSLQPDSFKSLYDIPHRLTAKMMKEFDRSLTQKILKIENEHESSFKMTYKNEAKKAFEVCMNRFAFNGCAKMLNKLMRKNILLKDDEKNYLTQLFNQNEEAIEQSMLNRMKELTDKLTSVGEQILRTLQLKISEIFFTAFNETPIKQQEDESSYSYVNQKSIYSERNSQKEYFPSCKQEQMLPFIKIKQQYVDPSQPCKNKQELSEMFISSSSYKPNTNKGKKRGKHSPVDQSNIISSQRLKRNDKVNYLNYHQFGNHSKEDFFEKAYIINSPTDIKGYFKNPKSATQFNVLIINYVIEFEELIDVIRFIKPKKIKINAQIIHYEDNFLSYLPLPILQNLVQFQQQWDCQPFGIKYANCEFVPQSKRSHSSNKSLITSQMWDNLRKMENVWISSQTDLEFIIGSRKSFSNLRCLKIQPLNGSIISPNEIRSRLGHLESLRTLIIKNTTFNQEYIDLFVDILKRNKLINCLVFKNVENINQECITQISKLNLTRLIIHFKQHPQNIDFRSLLSISTLEQLSIRGLRLDSNDYFNVHSIERHQLKNLQYLDLSNSKLTMGEISKCLHSTNYKNVKHLNLEKNQISEEIAYTLREFTSLFELNLNKTGLNLINFLKNMSKPLRSVEKLSLLGYYDPYDGSIHEQNAVLTHEALEMVFYIFPNIKHLFVSSPQSIPKARHYSPFSSLYVNGMQKYKKKVR